MPLYDILSSRYLDTEMQPIRRKNEFRALCNLMGRFEHTKKEHSIFIADRVFFAVLNLPKSGCIRNIGLSFRDMKQTISAEQFHCKSRDYIGMEIYARMVLYNFCSLITAHIVIEKKYKTYLSGQLFHVNTNMP